MKKPRIVKKLFKECEMPNWDMTTVLDITFKFKEERVQTLIKWIADKENKKNMKILIESARLEADKYFLNKEAELILKK